MPRVFGRKTRRKRRKTRGRRKEEKKKEKKYLTPIEEREPHLLREQCCAGTGPSNVKETRGASITSSNLTSPPLSGGLCAAGDPVYDFQPVCHWSAGPRAVTAFAIKQNAARRGIKLKIEGVRAFYSVFSALPRHCCDSYATFTSICLFGCGLSNPTSHQCNYSSSRARG